MLDPRYQAYNQQLLQQQNGDFVRFQLDVTEELRALMMDLLGYEYDEKDEEYKPSNKKSPMINVKGANDIMTFLRPRVTRIFSLSNQDVEAIDKRCLRYANDLTFMLCRHKDEYDIKSFQVMDNIIDLCDDIFNATALKSLRGWEGDSIRKGHSTIESKETVISQPKKPLTLPAFSR